MAGPKLKSISDAIKEYVSDGSTVAIGGMHGHNNPMALVRELVRQQKKIGTLVVSPSASLNADLPIGAGLVQEVLAPYIGFEHLGLAPSYRRAVEEGSVKVRECETSLIVNGLRAGAAGVKFHPVAPGVENTSIPDLNPDDYKWVTDPFTGSKVLCARAIMPDVALVHCSVADLDGNAVFGGSVFSDWDMIRASQKVVLMVEKVLEKVVDGPDELLSELQCRRPGLRLVPGMLIDAIVTAPFGCHPTSSHGNYRADEVHVTGYLEECGTKAGFDHYLNKFVIGTKDHDAYLVVVRKEEHDIEARLAIGPRKGPDGQSRSGEPDGPTLTELMIYTLAQELGDGEVAIMGANSSIPMLACMFAKETHAPNLTYLTGGSGGMNPKPTSIPLSSCDESLLTGPSVLELGDLIDAQVRHGADVFFAGGIQVDRNGNLNLIGVQKDDGSGYRLRGPGTAGLSLFNKARRIIVYLTHHSKKQLVEKVDHISGAGRPVHNVVKVVTPLAVFDFDDDGMRLRSIHPGSSIDDVVERTGFTIDTQRSYHETKIPTKEDIGLIRRLDPEGYVRHKVQPQ